METNTAVQRQFIFAMRKHAGNFKRMYQEIYDGSYLKGCSHGTVDCNF